MKKQRPSATAAPWRLASSHAVAALLLAAVIVSQPGCLGLAANLMHMVGADMVPPGCEELEDSRVAVVTTTESSHYKDDISAQLLSKAVGAILTQKVDDLKLVRHSEVEQYRDQVGWENVDYIEMGKKISADKVVSLELGGLKLREGATLFRGSATVTIKVFDVESGSVIYVREIDDYTYPRSAGQHVSETDEGRFRKLYLGMLAQEIGRTFHAYDLSDTFAIDGAIASQ